ncbi:MAG: DNA-protecting protein DprA [Solirubrobacterales bacterium]|nr:DNA-protecting protein DprA [Solirubrobacterales bacterium]
MSGAGIPGAGAPGAGTPGPAASACDACVRRTWLLGRLAGHLERARARAGDLLALDDAALIAAIGGPHAAAIGDERTEAQPAGERARCAALGVELVCRCSAAYPQPLRKLPAPPAVLHALGNVARRHELLSGPAVAVVGSRRPSPSGVAVAEALARDLSAAGVTVVSGLASGIDSAAHAGALEAGGRTVAVLAAGPDRPPAASRGLHARVLHAGLVVSELAPGASARRWMFPARNRIIAGLAAMTVVVQGRAGSGALLTAGVAAELGRPVGAVPGDIGSSLSVGPHRLLRGGATLVDGCEPVLDEVLGDAALDPRPGSARPGPPAPREPRAAALLQAIADGHEVPAAIRRAGLELNAGLAALAALELEGRLRRGPGGRYISLP